MATYIPGVGSYMPELKPFTPDYAFLSNVLDTKTNRYNTNYKQLNDLYSKVVYAELSRTDTKDMRDQYAESLAPKLEKVSGMDLSLVQNVDMARGLFKPFYEEDLIVKDLVVTKKYQNGIAEANSYKNSNDRAIRGQYWDIGVRGMNYMMDDFIKADPNKALSMANPTYVKNADLHRTALEILDASGLSDGIEVTMPDENNRYMIRRKNGDLIAGPAFSYIQNELMNDPRIKDAYYMQSYVASRDEAKKGMESGLYSTVDQGQRAWAMNTIAESQKLIEQAQGEQNTEENELDQITASYDAYRKEMGITPGSDVDKAAKKQFDRYQSLLLEKKATENIAADINSIDPNMSTQDLLNKAYNIYMGANMKNDMMKAAYDFSQQGKVYENKGLTDEYSKQLDFQYKKALEKYKSQLRREEAKDEEDAKKRQRQNMIPALRSKITGDASTITSGQDLEGSNFNALAQNAETMRLKTLENQELKINDVLKMIYQTQSKTEKGKQNIFTFTYTDADGVEQTFEGPMGHAGSATGNTLYELLHKRSPQQTDKDGEPLKDRWGLYELKPGYLYQDAINKAWNEYFEMLSEKDNEDGKNALTQKYPSITADSEEYIGLKNAFNYTKGELEQFINTDNVMFDHYLKQFNLADAAGGLTTEDYDYVNQWREWGLDFDIFDRRNKRILTREEFREKFYQGAKPIKLPRKRVGNAYVIDEDSEVYKGLTQYQKDKIEYGYAPNRYSNKGYWMDRNKMYLDYENRGAVSHPGRPNPGTTVYFFNRELANEDADRLYDAMITNLNNTQNGNYMKSSDDGVQTTTFSAYNPAFAFQGRPQTGQAEDIFNNPTYEININSAALANDPSGTAMFGDIIRQYNVVNNTEYSVQKGDPAISQGDDFDPKVNDEVANKLFELWIAENETFFRDPDARTTGSGILSNIKYRPVYGNVNDPEKPYGSYTITLPQDWLKKNQSLALSNSKNKSGFSSSELAKYSTITFTFDNNKDVSVRRKGNYNFSEVQAGIANSANGMYQRSYDNGGSLRVWQDVDGFYNLGVTYQQYDPKVDAMVDGPENTIVLDKIMGQQGYSLDDLDAYVMQYDLSIQNVMKENNRKRKEQNELNSAPKN